MNRHSANIHDRAAGISPTPRASAVYAQPGQPYWSPQREPSYNELYPGFQRSLTNNTSRNQFRSLRPVSSASNNLLRPKSGKRVSIPKYPDYNHVEAAKTLQHFANKMDKVAAANTLISGYHANSKKRANSSNSAERAKSAKRTKHANGGQINIYTGPKNGKYIIKNGVKVYINNKSLTNNVQYKKKAMPKKR